MSSLAVSNLMICLSSLLLDFDIFVELRHFELSLLLSLDRIRSLSVLRNSSTLNLLYMINLSIHINVFGEAHLR